MSITDPIKKFIFGIMLKKGVVSAAKLAVSYALAHGIKLNVALYGVTIDTSSEAAMALAINTALAMLKNWLKTKWPEKTTWL